MSREELSQKISEFATSIEGESVFIPTIIHTIALMTLDEKSEYDLWLYMAPMCAVVAQAGLEAIQEYEEELARRN